MKQHALAMVCLVCSCFLEITSHAAASVLDTRLEVYPGESWMLPASTKFWVGAGRPTLAGQSSELALRGELDLQPGLALSLGADLLQAAGFREERLRAGMVLGSSAWTVRAEWRLARGEVAGLLAESQSQVQLSLVTRSGPLSFGALQLVNLGTGPYAPRNLSSWALRLQIDRLALAVLREDARWGGDARWSAGLELALGEALCLGLRSDDAQGQLLLELRRGRMGLRVSIPLASAIEAGPYLALRWQPVAQGVAP